MKPALLVFCLCAALPARAQLSVGVSPAFVELTADPGQSAITTLTVINPGDVPIHVEALAQDWWYDEGSDLVFGAPGTYPRSAAAWMTFTPSELRLLPKQAATITLRLAVPAKAQGGHYAAAMIRVFPPPQNDQHGLRVGGQVGVLVFQQPAGPTAAKVSIESLSVEPPTETTPVVVKANLVNDGSSHAFPNGTLVVVSSERALVGHTGIPRRRIRPGQKLPVEATWAGELAPGDYQALVTIGYGEDRAVVSTASFTVPGAKR